MLDQPDAVRRRETLQRYHAAIATALTADELTVITSRFVANHRIGKDSPLGPDMGVLCAAHMERVAGMSSPAACDHALRELLA